MMKSEFLALIKSIITTRGMIEEIMDSQIKNNEKIQAIFNLIKRYREQEVVESDLDEFLIYRTCWNMGDFNVEDDKIEKHFMQLAISYLSHIIDFSVFRENIRFMYYNNKLSAIMQVLSYLIFLKKEGQLTKNLSYLNYISFCREMGIKPLNFSDFSSMLENEVCDYSIINSEKELGTLIDKSVTLLTQQRQYIAEFSETIPSNILEYLDMFIDHSVLSELAYQKLKNISEKLPIPTKISFQEFQQKFEEELKREQFPIVPIQLDPVIKPHATKIEAKPVNMSDITGLPKDLVAEFASIKAYSSPRSAQKVRIIFLGGGGIGNMGILIQHNNNAILIDAGMSVANYNIPRWHPSLKFVKAILVTHAHLDHTGALPYFVTPENGKRWYGSVSTKILTELLLFNTSQIIDEINASEEQLLPFYSSYLKKHHLINLFNVFHSLKPKKSIEISPGFTVTPYPSSHLFGSYGYEIEVFDRKILFTGDFSLNPSALFEPATMPTDCDITIFDGTYYNRQRENNDPDTVIMEAVENTSKLIIPAFSLGRAQEMLKRLERYRLTRNHTVKIVGLAAEVTKKMAISGKYKLLNDFSNEEFSEGDIVIAGNGMLQGGVARKLLEETKDDNDVGVLICGYQAPNTLGYALKTGNPIASLIYQQQIYIAPISGHSSAKQLDNFIEDLKGMKIMVHTPENTKLKSEHKHMVTIPNYLQTIEL